MVAAVTMMDVSRQRRMSLDLNQDRRITPRDTVSRALEHYVREMIDPAEFHHDSNWWAYSRGVKLDTKSRLEDLDPKDDTWLVMPETTAG
ncbi:MAG: hypothetical protein ABR915_13925 [Thermoguttaceae bacterium]|jgi:hypothetical protein